MGYKFAYIMLGVLLMVSMVSNMVCCSSTEFQAGGEVGWAIPGSDDSDMYNSWASHNRFRVGDTIYFKYKKDSVLVVNKEDYDNCVVSNPISKFADGHTVFELELFGFYYFISGQPGHCNSGQKMVVRVMVQSNPKTPKSSSAPGSDGGDEKGNHGWDSDDFGPPGFNATTRLSVASCFMTALVAMFIVFYLFL